MKILYINEDISAKAMFYIERYFLSHALEIADALIGATAIKYNLALITCNDKHYKVINELILKSFEFNKLKGIGF